MAKRGRKPNPTQGIRSNPSTRAIKHAIDRETKRMFDTLRAVRDPVTGTAKYTREEIKQAFRPALDRDFASVLNRVQPRWPYQTVAETTAADRALVDLTGPVDLEEEASHRGFANGLALATYLLSTLHAAFRRSVNIDCALPADFFTDMRVFTLLRHVASEFDLARDLFPELAGVQPLLGTLSKLLRTRRPERTPTVFSGTNRALMLRTLEEVNRAAAIGDVLADCRLEWRIKMKVGQLTCWLIEMDPEGFGLDFFHAPPHVEIEIFTWPGDRKAPKGAHAVRNTSR